MGGLGNLLFQVLSVWSIAEDHMHAFGINPGLRMGSHHSNKDYWSTIFSRFGSVLTFVTPSRVIQEENYTPDMRFSPTDYQFYGYWQHWKYLWKRHARLCSFLSFDTSVAEKYPRLHESAFVHIRGGDYVNHPVHGIELKTYYKNALKLLEQASVRHLYIFTNDRSFAERYFFLEDMDHTYVDEDEVNSLYLMSQCRFGGIAANSTFSWWGLFLNPNRPLLIIPDKWTHNNVVVAEQYAFPGTIVLPTSTS